MEILCAFQLVVFGFLPFVEQIMNRCDWLFLFTIIPVWGLLAWAWRAGRLWIAWAAAAYPLALLVWQLVFGVLWLTQGQGALRDYFPFCSC